MSAGWWMDGGADGGAVCITWCLLHVGLDVGWVNGKVRDKT
jgi:hypothetical protein